MKLLYPLLLLMITTMFGKSGMAQPVPAEEENIPFLVTFGANSLTSWGDDDFSQTFFFVIPEDNITPIYIRVFDPDTGGKHDEQKNEWNTHMRFSVYGGKECITHPDATSSDPTGNYKSGNLLASKVFAETDIKQIDDSAQLLNFYSWHTYVLICIL